MGITERFEAIAKNRLLGGQFSGQDVPVLDKWMTVFATPAENVSVIRIFRIKADSI